MFVNIKYLCTFRKIIGDNNRPYEQKPNWIYKITSTAKETLNAYDRRLVSNILTVREPGFYRFWSSIPWHLENSKINYTVERMV